ncbi:MAG: flavodoxin [Spirochaetia bacterium]|jgi:flavodoxin short chain|nr:flavodoxin [Spirochaetia bacterium]
MNTVVIYWSQTGNTEAMARAVAVGAGNCEIFYVDNITAEQALSYDALALGCPAMGDETLEEEEFQPFIDALLPKVKGKRVALFGSYGWGDGTWMQNWQTVMEDSGALLVQDGLICNNEPDEKIMEQCRQLGKKLSQ